MESLLGISEDFVKDSRLDRAQDSSATLLESEIISDGSFDEGTERSRSWVIDFGGSDKSCEKVPQAFKGCVKHLASKPPFGVSPITTENHTNILNLISNSLKLRGNQNLYCFRDPCRAIKFYDAAIAICLHPQARILSRFIETNYGAPPDEIPVNAALVTAGLMEKMAIPDPIQPHPTLFVERAAAKLAINHPREAEDDCSVVLDGVFESLGMRETDDAMNSDTRCQAFRVRALSRMESGRYSNALEDFHNMACLAVDKQTKVEAETGIDTCHRWMQLLEEDADGKGILDAGFKKLPKDTGVKDHMNLFSMQDESGEVDYEKKQLALVISREIGKLSARLQEQLRSQTEEEEARETAMKLSKFLRLCPCTSSPQPRTIFRLSGALTTLNEIVDASNVHLLLPILRASIDSNSRSSSSLTFSKFRALQRILESGLEVTTAEDIDESFKSFLCCQLASFVADVLQDAACANTVSFECRTFAPTLELWLKFWHWTASLVRESTLLSLETRSLRSTPTLIENILTIWKSTLHFPSCPVPVSLWFESLLGWVQICGEGIGMMVTAENVELICQCIQKMIDSAAIEQPKLDHVHAMMEALENMDRQNGRIGHPIHHTIDLLRNFHITDDEE